MFQIPVPVNVNVAVAFDLARGNVLATPLPPVRDALHTATSVTTSRYRLRWNRLSQWATFEDDMNNYFTNNVTAADIAALVMNFSGLQQFWNAVNESHIRTEAQIKLPFLTYAKEVHNIVANGMYGAPPPSDVHSSIVEVDSGAGSHGLVGVSDFALRNDLEGRITVVGEVKNPWKVTPEQIDQVIDGYPNYLLSLIIKEQRHSPENTMAVLQSSNSMVTWFAMPKRLASLLLCVDFASPIALMALSCL